MKSITTRMEYCLVVVCICATAFLLSGAGGAAPSAESGWIWHPKGQECQHYRHDFTLDESPEKLAGALLRVMAEKPYAVFVNGQRAAKGDNWEAAATFPLEDHLQKGQNTVRLQCQGGQDGGIIATGPRLSERTVEAIRRRARQGATVIMARRLAPDGVDSGQAGDGRWLLTDDFTSERVRRVVEPYLGPESELRYVFGNNEVTFSPTRNERTRLEVHIQTIGE
jgi:hypothetical protein